MWPIPIPFSAEKPSPHLKGVTQGCDRGLRQEGMDARGNPVPLSLLTAISRGNSEREAGGEKPMSPGSWRAGKHCWQNKASAHHPATPGVRFAG